MFSSSYRADDPAAARSTWQRALDILVQLNHPDAHRIRAKLGQPA